MTRPERDPVARSLAEYWPIFGLQLATPRLVLTPLQDDDLVETLDLILAGIHDSGRMPFKTPWTDAPRDELIANTLRYYWSSRAGWTSAAWTVPFVVRRSGVLVGMQDLVGKDFSSPKRCRTGSWLGAAHQGSGIGTEMREAVLQFAFDHLKAERADSGAFLDNPASLRVSEKLGYRHGRHGRAATPTRRARGRTAADPRALAVPPVGLGGAGPWPARLPGVLRALTAWPASSRLEGGAAAGRRPDRLGPWRRPRGLRSPATGPSPTGSRRRRCSSPPG